MANALVPSFRLPISIPEDAAHPAVREALLTHDNGLVSLNQALKALNSKITGKTSAVAPSTTTVIQNSETIVQGSAGNTGTVNNQSGNTSYATQQSDNGALIVLSDASPVALSLTTSLVLPWFCVPVNQGAGLVTITPAAGNINGGASITLPTGYFAVIAYDGANFWAATQPIVPVNTPAVAHQWLSAYNAATGAFTQTQPVYADIGGTIPTWNQNTTGTAANLSGTPLLPNGTTAATQTPGDTSSDIATDAFVAAAVAVEKARALAAEATKQDALTLTTTGSGAATLTGATLNIPTPSIPAAPLAGTSGSIGGSPLLVGATIRTTVSIPGATTGMAAVCSPVTYPGDGTTWDAYVSTSGVVTVRLTAIVALTPVSSTYNVRCI